MLIEAEANGLWEKLRVFDPKQRLFVLAEINNRVTRRLRSRESTRYHVDFTRDEEPITEPELDIGDRETRKIDVDSLQDLRKKTRE